mmetsp:Transcript_1675/g.5284  ORF Transcript_1675/g.5284 Transcript_1675/m.5284 type:complete len:336 (-) Transcript_1675:643-1650(-)
MDILPSICIWVKCSPNMFSDCSLNTDSGISHEHAAANASNTASSFTIFSSTSRDIFCASRICAFASSTVFDPVKMSSAMSSDNVGISRENNSFTLTVNIAVLPATDLTDQSSGKDKLKSFSSPVLIPTICSINPGNFKSVVAVSNRKSFVSIPGNEFPLVSIALISITATSPSSNPLSAITRIVAKSLNRFSNKVSASLLSVSSFPGLTYVASKLSIFFVHCTVGCTQILITYSSSFDGVHSGPPNASANCLGVVAIVSESWIASLATNCIACGNVFCNVSSMHSCKNVSFPTAFKSIFIGGLFVSLFFLDPSFFFGASNPGISACATASSIAFS